MSVLIRGWRNAFRNVVRSVGTIAVLALVVALAISMLLARQAVNSKINSVKASTGTTIRVTPAGFFGGQGGGTALKSSELDKLADIPNVTGVTQQLEQRLSSSETNLTSPIQAGNLGGQFGGGGFGGSSGSSQSSTFVMPVTVTGATTPGTALTEGAGGSGGSTEKLTAGTTFTAGSTKDVAVVGTSLASTNNLKVGSTFTAWGTPIKVIGIYNAGSTFANAGVLMPLETVQKLSGNTGEATGATVTANSVDNVASVAAEVKKEMGSSVNVISSQQLAESELSPLSSVATITLWTLIAALVAAGLIVLATMVMIVRERRREIGVLKAIGASSSSVIRQFMVEAITLTGIAGLAGLVIGILASNPIASSLVSSQTSSTSSTGFGGPPGSGSGGFFHPGGTSGGFSGGFSGGTRPGGGSSFFHGGFFHGVSSSLTSVQTSAGWSTVVLGLVAIIFLAAIASAVAAWSTSRIRPAEILRSE
jgi:putative ABC transport system permease protein